eukprot:1276672-Rhodomonas_salina.2
MQMLAFVLVVQRGSAGRTVKMTWKLTNSRLASTLVPPYAMSVPQTASHVADHYALPSCFL